MENGEFISFTDTISLAEHLAMMKLHGNCAELVNQISKEVSEIVISRPFDAHLHLRDGDMLKAVAPSSATTFAWGVIMPNLLEPVESYAQVVEYEQNISWAKNWEVFKPYMTMNFRPDYTRESLKTVKNHIIGIKMYPKWQTTNSEWWVNGTNIEAYRNVLEIMQDLWIPLLIHGEVIDGWYKIDELDKERKFAPVYEKLAQEFPGLKIIMEHVSTKECMELTDTYPNLYATVTLHHLLLIHNDVVSKWIKPHNYCMPIAKLWDDRKAILKYALSWHPKVMFGSDSAPHEVGKKECDCWCAGIFTAPIALQALTEIFESFWQLDNLNKFVSGNAGRIYGIHPPEKNIELIKKWCVVPKNKDLPKDYPNERKELYTPAKLFLEWKRLVWNIKRQWT